MNNVTSVKAIPDSSNVVQGFGPVSYADTFRLSHPLNGTIDQIVTDIFTVPDWVNGLMRVRNTIVRPFGLKTGDEAEFKSAPYYHVGSRAVYYTVIERKENEIIMEENDKHLKFRISVLTDYKESNIYLTTLVHFNNLFGRLYFFIVKPFHKMIVRSVLQRLSITNNRQITL